MRLSAATLLAAFAALGAVQQSPQTQITVDRLRGALQPIGAEPIEVLEAEKAWSGAARLFELARPTATGQEVRNSITVRGAAVRAIGRLEDPRLVPDVVALPDISASTRGNAVAQLLFGFDPSTDPRLLDSATGWMFAHAPLPIGSESRMGAAASVVGPMARIRYANPEQVHHVEEVALGVINYAAHNEYYRGAYLAAVRAME